VKVKNPKFEARNPKQIPMPENGGNIETKDRGLRIFYGFEFRICFEFRISDFVL